MSRLVLCTACERHVRRSESTCPFCGGGVVAPPAALPRGPALKRAALLVSGIAAASASLAGCADDGSASEGAQQAYDESAPELAAREAEMAQPVYGVAIDAGLPRATPPAASDAGSDAGTPVGARPPWRSPEEPRGRDPRSPREPREPRNPRDPRDGRDPDLVQPVYGIAAEPDPER